jgi:hypothetical protein
MMKAYNQRQGGVPEGRGGRDSTNSHIKKPSFPAQHVIPAKAGIPNFKDA